MSSLLRRTRNFLNSKDCRIRNIDSLMAGTCGAVSLSGTVLADPLLQHDVASFLRSRERFGKKFRRFSHCLE